MDCNVGLRKLGDPPVRTSGLSCCCLTKTHFTVIPHADIKVCETSIEEINRSIVFH